MWAAVYAWCVVKIGEVFVSDGGGTVTVTDP